MNSTIKKLLARVRGPLICVWLLIAVVQWCALTDGHWADAGILLAPFLSVAAAVVTSPLWGSLYYLFVSVPRERRWNQRIDALIAEEKAARERNWQASKGFVLDTLHSDLAL